MGIIKNCIKEAILDGEISNDFDQAYRLMVEKGREQGLTIRNPLKKGSGSAGAAEGGGH